MTTEIVRQYMTDPEINQPLFQKVYNQIFFHPTTHGQHSWEAGDPDSECGTTRCVAGWAIYLNALAKHSKVDSIYSHISGSVFQDGKRLLGLTEEEAHQLFHGVSDERAVELVEQYALKGRLDT